MDMSILDSDTASKINTTATARIGPIKMALNQGKGAKNQGKNAANFSATVRKSVVFPQTIWSENFPTHAPACEHTLKVRKSMRMFYASR